MRIPMAIASVTLLLLGGASIAAAKTPTHKLTGQIVSVDTATKTLSVREHPTESHSEAMKFSVASDAKIMAGASAEDLSHLKIGDPVTVTYVTQGETHTATRIEVAKAAPPAKKSGY